MASIIQKNDVGIDFQLQIVSGGVAIDISTATLKRIIFEKPSGNLLVVTASFYTDGTDGIIRYTSLSGDLSESGLWRVQGHVTLASGSDRHSDTKTFRVYKNINDTY